MQDDFRKKKKEKEVSTVWRLLWYHEQWWWTCAVTNNTQKNIKKRKWVNLELENEFFKTSRSQQHNDYHVFVRKQGRDKEASQLLDLCSFGVFVAENGFQTAPLWKSWKIENDTKIQLSNKDWHRDPLKTVPRSGFEKHEKQWKLDRKIRNKHFSWF